MKTIFRALKGRTIHAFIALFYYLIIIPVLIIIIIIIRSFGKKRIDVGLGPEPMINNIYHKKALEHSGYSAETFVGSVYFITSDFDYRADLQNYNKYWVLKYFSGVILFLRAISRYKCVYIYFHGGPLSGYSFLKNIESQLFKLGNTRVLVMPYGGDVNDMTLAVNLKFKHAIDVDYPEFYKRNENVREQIKRWTMGADKVVSGCDWVDYMYHWDKLMIAHFSIDTERILEFKNPDYVLPKTFSKDRPLKILHAPNHKSMKGTSFIEQAVKDLQTEGYPIELILMQKQPNATILKTISEVDIVADQLVIGWYAMFALEGLSLSKPVICFLREDLLELYMFAGLIKSREELPFLNTDVFGVKKVLEQVLNGEIDLEKIKDKCIPYVNKHHSISYIGSVFDELNQQMGIIPSLKKQTN